MGQIFLIVLYESVVSVLDLLRNHIPLMGNLLSHRTFPFLIVDIDYNSSFEIKSRYGRINKTLTCYICLFICFSINEIYLNLISNLTTQGFVSIIKRFIARHGKPQNVYSDNDTKFKMVLETK